jgi:hypothetical protein
LKLHTLTKRQHDFRAVAEWTEAKVERRMSAKVRELDAVAEKAGYPPTTDAFAAVVQAAARARRRARGAVEQEDE